jgi:hypothetical protein
MTTMKSAAKTKSTRKGDIEAIKLPNPNGIDLLVLAFSRIGGSAEAVARELGVTERRVYSILDKVASVSLALTRPMKGCECQHRTKR